MGLAERGVASVVWKACGFSGEELRGSGQCRPQSRARILAGYLARGEGGISIARMARFFGREESTMVRGVLRLEQELTASADLRREVARLGNAVRSA
jgi:chromosomal replication initiation ATPase DnaA